MEALSWSKVTVKTFIMLQTIYNSKLYELVIHQQIQKQQKSYHKKYSASLLKFSFGITWINSILKHIKKENSYIKQFSTLKIMINVSWAGNQHIIMLSGGSCDTEGISKLTGINYI